MFKNAFFLLILVFLISCSESATLSVSSGVDSPVPVPADGESYTLPEISAGSRVQHGSSGVHGWVGIDEKSAEVMQTGSGIKAIMMED